MYHVSVLAYDGVPGLLQALAACGGHRPFAAGRRRALYQLR